MNWYKQSTSFIDTIIVGSYTSSTLVLYVKGKRYCYSGVEGQYYAELIERWKKWKNKHKAGQQVSILIKNLRPYLVDNKQQALNSRRVGKIL